MLYRSVSLEARASTLFTAVGRSVEALLQKTDAFHLRAVIIVTENFHGNLLLCCMAMQWLNLIVVTGSRKVNTFFSRNQEQTWDNFSQKGTTVPLPERCRKAKKCLLYLRRCDTIVALQRKLWNFRKG